MTAREYLVLVLLWGTETTHMMNHTGSTGQGSAFPEDMWVWIGVPIRIMLLSKGLIVPDGDSQSGKMLGKLPPSVPTNASRSQASPHPSHFSSSTSTDFCSPFSGPEQLLPLVLAMQRLCCVPAKCSLLSPVTLSPCPVCPRKQCRGAFSRAVWNICTKSKSTHPLLLSALLAFWEKCCSYQCFPHFHPISHRIFPTDGMLRYSFQGSSGSMGFRPRISVAPWLEGWPTLSLGLKGTVWTCFDFAEKGQSYLPSIIPTKHICVAFLKFIQAKQLGNRLWFLFTRNIPPCILIHGIALQQDLICLSVSVLMGLQHSPKRASLLLDWSLTDQCLE